MAKVINRNRPLQHPDLLRLRRAIDNQDRARHVALRELARRLVAAHAMLAMADQNIAFISLSRRDK